MSRYILAPAPQEYLVAIRDYYLTEAGCQMARQMLVEFTKGFTDGTIKAAAKRRV